MTEQKRNEEFELKFISKEEFVAEVEKVFSSLKEHQPFSLGVEMGYPCKEMGVEVEWRITSPDEARQWSLAEVEFMLGVVVSRQTPNVRETKLDFCTCKLGDISAEVWKLLSKLNNLTHLNLGDNNLSVVSPLVGDLIHLRILHLHGNRISPEGVVGVCELLKVCCSIAYLLVACG